MNGTPSTGQDETLELVSQVFGEVGQTLFCNTRS